MQFDFSLLIWIHSSHFDLWLFHADENQLTGSIPSEIGLLISLNHTDIDQLAGTIPSEKGQALVLETQVPKYSKGFGGSVAGRYGS